MDSGVMPCVRVWQDQVGDCITQAGLASEILYLNK